MGPDWEVKLGWGLHVGWAIEGAIGSRYKIDASYLSPHVNLAEDLEAATKFYGVPFLVSEQMYNILSPTAQRLCRQVDRVHIAGIENPFNLYCVDIWQFQRDKLDAKGIVLNGPTIGTYESPEDEISYMSKTEKKFYFDETLANVHAGFPIQWRKQWEIGFQHYLDGNWSDAKIEMQKSLDMMPTDGAAMGLLGYMQKFEFQAPQNWPNYREHD